jgi:uncharacterized protein YegP (UPF0339 family)
MPEIYFNIVETPKGFGWQLMGADGRIIAVSAEWYETIDLCRDSIDLVRKSRSAGIRDPEDG